jgi:hypothetical protein
MQVLYGKPLPPGLVAPTQGELRLRIEQLLLDENSINNNPLVQLFDTGVTAESEDVASAGITSTASASSAPVRSPNRFVVPVDYCAVGPIFWGETRPTAQGQPSTPQLHRGPLTMAYPIKIAPAQFRAYLQRMTASPQGGVQLDVFVPSSYSGRPPVTVGKARLALDQLHPGHPIHGWYPVLHRRRGISGLAVSAASDAVQLKEIPVGKVKVSVSVEYYPTTQRASQYSAYEVRGVPHQQSAKHRRHVEVAGNGAAALLPQAKTRRSARHAGRAGTHHSPLSTSSSVTSETFSSEANLRLSAAHIMNDQRVRVHQSHPSVSALAQDLPSTTRRLLAQGLRLRAQMDAAARGVDVDAAPSFMSDDTAVKRSSSKHKGMDGAAAAAALTVDDYADAAAATYDRGGTDDDDGYDDDNGGDDSAYTSEVSDEENFALQLQRDSEARDSRSTQQQQQRQQSTQMSALPQHKSYQPSAPQDPPQQQSLFNSQMTARSFTSVEGHAAGIMPASVELCFSHFSFAQTPATADLSQLRLSVRLSSDITTNEPTPGPLSSYVHPVPFEQPSICLHFNVCSYAEDRSKLVVEAYKVVAETEVADEGNAWGMQGPRQVACEELLGLSVVGLYRQSREIVFRDPVLDSSNVFAHLDIRVQSAPAAPAALQGGARDGAVVASACVTPISDAAPLSSIACLTAPQPGALKQKNMVNSSTPPPPPQNPHPLHSQVTEQDTPTGDSARILASQTPVRAARVSLPPAPSQSVQPLSQVQSYVSVSERRRLRVVVHSAAELPRVAVAQHGGRMSARYPLVSSSPRVVADAGVTNANSYVEPSTFVTIEEVFQTFQHSLIEHEKTAGTASDKSRARMEAMSNWYVDEARSGYYDRSAVAEASSNPYYGYEVLLQLPEVTMPAPTIADENSLVAARNVFTNETMHPRVTVDLLEELQLNVWHSDYSLQSPPEEISSTANRAKMQQHQRQEENFWSAAAYMGTCRVDLRPLRYLPMINGYYRVVCERTQGSATDQTDTDTEANTIGYVRVSVSLL